MTKQIFGYGHVPRSLTIFVEQDGKRFNLVLGRVDALGLRTTKRPILWATYPGRGNARAARRWFKRYAREHGLGLTFDR
jgi:hypothetical protein